MKKGKRGKQKMNHNLNQYLIREYEKLDSGMEQREFAENMRFLMMAKEKDFSDYYSRRNLTGREFYSVMDTLYELNNLWMLSGFIRQNQQVLLRETQEDTEYRKKQDFTEICRIGKDTMLSRMFQVMGKFHLDEYVAKDTDYTVITRRVKAYAATTGSGKTVPQIMLQGNRVRKWGFEAGSSMRVERFPNKLVILKE